jgi:hypothetical protein
MVYIHSKLFLQINTQWVLQHCCSKILWIVLTKHFKHLVVVVFAKWQYSLVAYGAMLYVNICKVVMHFWMEEMPKCHMHPCFAQTKNREHKQHSRVYKKVHISSYIFHKVTNHHVKVMKNNNLSKFVSGLNVANDQELFNIPCPSCFESQICIKKLMVLQLQFQSFFGISGGMYGATSC